MGKKNKINLNLNPQFYKGIQIRLIERHDYKNHAAKRFMLGDERRNQNIWIPNQYLLEDGTLKTNVNIDFIMRKAYVQKKFKYAEININPMTWKVDVMFFKDEYEFLSNMYPCKVNVNISGVIYTFKSSESAFQAFKSKDMDTFLSFLDLDGYKAKKKAKKMKEDGLVRDDWQDVSIQAMEYVLRCKFDQNPDLKEKLIAINGYIAETNYWKDTFWGVCNGIGENNLGKLLMKLREEYLHEKRRVS